MISLTVRRFFLIYRCFFQTDEEASSIDYKVLFITMIQGTAKFKPVLRWAVCRILPLRGGVCIVGYAPFEADSVRWRNMRRRISEIDPSSAERLM